MLEPGTSVQYVKGIGPRLAEILRDKGIHTVDDLLHYLPFRYEDRLNPRTIAELRLGEMATVIAEIRRASFVPARTACSEAKQTRLSRRYCAGKAEEPCAAPVAG